MQKRNWEMNDFNKSAKLFEMREAYKKLQCKTTTGQRDMSGWEMGQFHEICRENFACYASNVSKQVGVDHL